MVVSSNCLALTRHFYSVEERSDELLERQLEEASCIVKRLVKRPLADYQYDALICLVGDIVAGLANPPLGDFSKSLLLEAVNKGMFQIAAAEFHTFCYVNGRPDMWAWRKRRVEHYLFSRGLLILE